MKILYSIQGTGNGHVSRAREIIPHLQNYGELDLLISGTAAEVGLEDEVKFRLNGFGFVFGKDGGVDLRETWRRFDFVQFLKDIKNLPVKDYDLIINDFEPVAAWSCKIKGKESVAMSHQAAYLSPKTPQIKGFHWGKIIMDSYAPAKNHIAFHFQKYDDFINTPVIRSEIRNLETSNLGHYTVYLPAYSDEFILDRVKNIPNSKWEVFSKHSREPYEKFNAEIFPVNNEKFQNSLANCAGLLTGGGFEGPAEALFLKKKVLAVPMKNQYEQQCNALALEKLGVPVIWKESEFDEKLKSWVENEEIIAVNFPDETAEIVRKMVKNYG
ncbi:MULTISPECIES: glycosyltransferase family protein [Chryseobacterium]|uniref:glycosyltransferase family protein n=1 Tax=Chryseobacterium sp. R2A-55 TaxID=2744445 RepID=UPI001F3BE519|nr:glycosyltransferase family protein [Chryseobacterium sp. R2A-55]